MNPIVSCGYEGRFGKTSSAHSLDLFHHNRQAWGFLDSELLHQYTNQHLIPNLEYFHAKSSQMIHLANFLPKRISQPLLAHVGNLKNLPIRQLPVWSTSWLLACRPFERDRVHNSFAPARDSTRKANLIYIIIPLAPEVSLILKAKTRQEFNLYSYYHNYYSSVALY